MLFLIPFNFLALFGTIKYFQNVQRIAKIFWPKRQKASIGNFFFIGTVQAAFFTTFYIGGTLAILGINPIKIIKNNENDFDATAADERQLEKAAEGMRMTDVFVLRMFKAMGLSEQTMSQIESDLRTG